MKHLIEKYHELDSGDRLRVELFVEEHPEYRNLLEHHRRLGGALHRVRSPRPDVTDDDLARFVTRGDAHEDKPSHIKTEYERLQHIAEEDPVVREKLQGYAARYEELQSSFDPVAHFESLRGGAGAVGSEAGEPKLSYVSRPAQPPRRLARVAKWSLPIAAGLALLVVSLVVLDGAATSPLERESAFRSDELDRRQYTFTLRSNDIVAFTRADSLFISALDALGSAEKSFFGLFRSYDEASLAGARRDLEEVVALEEEGAFLALEAHYLLGKIMVQIDQVDQAQVHLREVVREGGVRADRAERLLETIDDAK